MHQTTQYSCGFFMSLGSFKFFSTWSFKEHWVPCSCCCLCMSVVANIFHVPRGNVKYALPSPGQISVSKMFMILVFIVSIKTQITVITYLFTSKLWYPCNIYNLSLILHFFPLSLSLSLFRSLTHLFLYSLIEKHITISVHHLTTRPLIRNITKCCMCPFGLVT